MPSEPRDPGLLPQAKFEIDAKQGLGAAAQIQKETKKLRDTVVSAAKDMVAATNELRKPISIGQLVSKDILKGLGGEALETEQIKTIIALINQEERERKERAAIVKQAAKDQINSIKSVADAEKKAADQRRKLEADARREKSKEKSRRATLAIGELDAQSAREAGLAELRAVQVSVAARKQAAAQVSRGLIEQNKAYDQQLRAIDDVKLRSVAASKAIEKQIGSQIRLFRRSQLDLRDMAFGAQQLAAPGQQFFRSAVQGGREFEKQVTLIGSLLRQQLGEDVTQDLRKGILDLPPALGAAEDQAASLYELLQAGIPAADALNFLRDAATAAKGDLAGVHDAIQAGVPVYELYSNTIKDVGGSVGITDELFDKLLATVDIGRIRLQDFSSTIGPLASQARAAGIGLDEMLGALATLTQVLKPEQAAISLANALRAIVNPTDKAAASARLLGIEFTQANLRTRGFVGIMEQLASSGASGLDVLNELFPEIRAVRGASFLAGEGLDDMRKAIEFVSGATGNSQERFKEWQGTLDASIEGVKGSLSRLNVSVTESIRGVIEKEIALVGGAIAKLEELQPGTKRVAGTLALVGTQGAAAAGSVALLTVGARQGSQALSQLGTTGKIVTAILASLPAALVVYDIFTEKALEAVRSGDDHKRSLRETVSQYKVTDEALAAVNKRLDEHKAKLRGVSEETVRAEREQRELEAAFNAALSAPVNRAPAPLEFEQTPESAGDPEVIRFLQERKKAEEDLKKSIQDREISELEGLDAIVAAHRADKEHIDTIKEKVSSGFALVSSQEEVALALEVSGEKARAAADAQKKLNQEYFSALDSAAIFDKIRKSSDQYRDSIDDLGLRLEDFLETSGGLKNFDPFDRNATKKRFDEVLKIAVQWAKDMPAALRPLPSELSGIIQEALDNVYEIHDKGLEDSKKELEEFSQAWRDFEKDLIQETPEFQSHMEDLGHTLQDLVDSQRFREARLEVLAFADTWDLDVKEAIGLATQALQKHRQEQEKQARERERQIEEIAREEERAAKQIQKAWDGLDESLRQRDAEFVSSVRKLGEEVAVAQSRIIESGNASEQQFRRQEALILDFAEAWGIDLPDAIQIAQEAVDDFNSDQMDATQALRDAFREAVEEFLGAWRDFTRSGIESTDEYQQAVERFGETISGLAEKGDVGGQLAQVQQFARAWGLDYTEAVGVAQQAMEQFRANQKQRLAEIAQAWASFNRDQLLSSETYKGALESLGDELLRYQGKQQATQATVEAFARRFDLELPEAIGIASQALQQAQEEVRRQQEAEEQYLAEVQGLWDEYKRARVEGSQEFQKSLDALGQSLLKQGGDISFAQAEVARFAQRWGLELPEAIRTAIGAYQEAARASAETTGQIEGDTEKSIDLWERYWRAVTEGSSAYQESLGALGESLADLTGDQQQSQQLIADFAEKWGLELPDAIGEAISALNDARKSSGDTAGALTGDADEIAAAFEDLRLHILRSQEGYEAAFSRLGELVAQNSGDIRSLEPQIRAFADTWGYTLPDAIREAESAYDDVRAASRQAADEMARDAERIEDAFQSYFQAFQSESAAYQKSIDDLGQQLVGLGSNVQAQRAAIEAFARAWGLDTVDAIREAEGAVRKVLEAQEEARNGWGKLTTYAQQSASAQASAIQGTAQQFQSTAQSAQVLGTAIQQAITPGQDHKEFQKSFDKNVTDPIKKAEGEAQKLKQTLAALTLTTGGVSGVGGGFQIGPAPGYDFGAFQHGGQFRVPARHPGTDRTRVSFRATAGETVTVTPASSPFTGNGPIFRAGGSGFTGNGPIFLNCTFVGSPDRTIADRWALTLGDAQQRASRRGQISVLNQRF